MTTPPRSSDLDRTSPTARLIERIHQLELAVAAVADLVVVVDQSYRVVECNGASERIWGIARAELLGQRLPSLSGRVTLVNGSGVPLAPHDAPTARAIATGISQVAPLIGVRRGDGSVTWTRVVAIPLPHAFAERRLTISVWTDLTAAVEGKDTLRRMDVEVGQRVEERTAELSQTVTELAAFNYRVSHDLRSPARAIHTLVETLLEDWEARSDATSVLALEKVRDASARMGGLIDVLMDLSAAASVEPERSRIDLTALARDELEHLAEADPLRRVVSHVADRLVVEADERMVTILLQNLLGNAWKFTQRSTAPQIDVGANTSEGRTVFFVRDNGAGFDMAESERLFVPFERLSTAHRFAGSGIGLATVNLIVTRHGGRVWADAAPGTGATFFFTLPPPV